MFLLFIFSSYLLIYATRSKNSDIIPSVVYELNYHQPSALILVQKDLATVSQCDVLAYRDCLLIGYIIHIWQASVDQTPLYIVKMKITYRLPIIIARFLVSWHQII